MKQEFQYSTKLQLFDDHRFSVNYYVAFAALSEKFSVNKLTKLLDGKFDSGHNL